MSSVGLSGRYLDALRLDNDLICILLPPLVVQEKIGIWGEAPLLTKNVSFWSKTVKKARQGAYQSLDYGVSSS